MNYVFYCQNIPMGSNNWTTHSLQKQRLARCPHASEPPSPNFGYYPHLGQPPTVA